MKRSQWILVGLLVAQVALILLTRGPWVRAEAGEVAGPLLPALESVSPTRIEIDGTEGKEVTLVRDGARWEIEQAAGFPADSQKVATLIQSLKNLEVRRPIVRSSRYHEALEVSDRKHERRLRVAGDARGKAVTGVYLGSSPNYRITHVRREGDDRVYEATGLGVYDVPQDASGWMDTRLLDVEADAVTSIQIENSRGRFEAVRRDGKWTLAGASGAGATLDAAKVSDLIRVAATLRLSDPAGKLDAAAQGLATPAATVTLRTAEGEAILKVGAKVAANDGKRYVARAGSEFAAMTFEGSVEKFVSGKAADLK